MNIVFTPYGWEWRIREGQLSGQLLRPLHPIHYDVAQFAGGKIPWLLYYLPIGAILALLFDPTFDVRPAEIAVFAVAIWGAYLIRTFNQSALGLVTFWTTRVGALFSLYIVLELLLSGRIVPLTVFPALGADRRVVPTLPAGRSTSRSRRSWAISRTRSSSRDSGCRCSGSSPASESSRSSGAMPLGATRRWATDARPPGRRGLSPGKARLRRPPGAAGGRMRRPRR